MLDTKNLTLVIIRECRSNETWFKRFVKKHAPKGTTCEIEELRVNDVEGDEYIFCEVTLTCNKRKHHFNYYAGTDGVTLVERLGGRKGEKADGDKMGKEFQMEFSMPSADDMDNLEEFLEHLADYAPKKPKTTKAKNITFFTVVAYARIGGEINNNRYKDVFKKKQKAAKFIASEVNDYIEQENLENEKVTSKDCMKGYCISAYNDADDCVEFDIVKHTVPADFFKK